MVTNLDRGHKGPMDSVESACSLGGSQLMNDFQQLIQQFEDGYIGKRHPIIVSFSDSDRHKLKKSYLSVGFHVKIREQKTVVLVELFVQSKNISQKYFVTPKIYLSIYNNESC